MADLLRLENEENPKGSLIEQVARSEAECQEAIDKHDDSLLQCIFNDSYLRIGVRLCNIDTRELKVIDSFQT